MKICLINNLYKPFNRGGAERVVEIVVGGLKDAGHDVFIISTKPLFKRFKILDFRFKIYYLSGLYFNLKTIPKFLRLFWHTLDMFDIGSFLRVKEILKKEKPDVVMTHNLKGVGYLIPLAIRMLGIKHIHTLHDIQLLHPSGLMLYGEEKKINSMFAKIYANICQWLFGSPDIVISPSKWLMGEHVDRGFFRKSEKIVMANPAVASKKQKNKKTKKQKNNFKCLYVGQIEEHKGVLFLIDIFQNLDSELFVVGNGSKLEEIKKMASSYNNIKILGRLTVEEAQELMSEVDCLIAPSLCYENSPTVIYMALASGLPIVASRIGGISELLKDEGLLFEPGNKDDLTRQIKCAQNNKEEFREMGENGLEKVKRFEVEKYIKRLAELL